jgi:hypothetical protein
MINQAEVVWPTRLAQELIYRLPTHRNVTQTFTVGYRIFRNCTKGSISSAEIKYTQTS